MGVQLRMLSAVVEFGNVLELSADGFVNQLLRNVCEFERFRISVDDEGRR